MTTDMFINNATNIDSTQLDQQHNFTVAGQSSAQPKNAELQAAFDELWSPTNEWLDRFLDTPLDANTIQDMETSRSTALLRNPEIEQLLQDPELLLDGPQDIAADELRRYYSIDFLQGRLTDESKAGVNQLISQLSQSLDKEVHASVYFSEQGAGRIKLTTGSKTQVEFTLEDNTLYSAHTHLSEILKATPADVRSAVPGAEDAVVVNGEGLIYA